METLRRNQKEWEKQIACRNEECLWGRSVDQTWPKKVNELEDVFPSLKNREEKEWKKGTEEPRSVGWLQKLRHAGIGNSRKRRKKWRGEIFGARIAENYPKISTGTKP